jgi:drug/metabolite transporter (DMT)-like permease
LLTIQALGLLLAVALLLVSRERMPPATALAWAALGGMAGLVGLLCLYQVLARGTMGLVAPATALIAAAVPAAVGILWGDRVDALVLAGMALALVAVVLISLPDRGLQKGRTGSDMQAAQSDPAAAAVPGPDKAAWLLIVVSGLGFATFYLCLDQAQRAGGSAWWDLSMVRLAALSVAAFAALVLLATRRAPPLRVTRAVLPLAVLAAIGDTGGNLFYVMARSVADAAGTLSVTVVVVSLYPVSTVLLARVILHERLSRLRTLAVGLAVGAVALIGVGATRA